MAMNYREVGEGIPGDERAKYASGIQRMNSLASALQKEGLLPEKFGVLNFSKEARQALLEDGATIYGLTGETIRAQQEAGRPFWYVPQVESLLTLPSRRMEIAIYADPKRFFVPESFDKTKSQQEALVVREAQALRERLGISGITMILPEAPEATEAIFRHFDQTEGVRLLGEDYKDPKNGWWRYIRTNTPTNSAGSEVADVGCFLADYGLRIGDWDAGDRYGCVGAARWVVPTRDR